MSEQMSFGVVCPHCGKNTNDPVKPKRVRDPRVVASDTRRRALEILAEFRRMRTRATDPVASHLAADRFSVVKGPQRVKAYVYLVERGKQGATLEEIARAIGVRENAISSELSRMRDEYGLLEYGELRETSRGTSMGVWRAV